LERDCGGISERRNGMRVQYSVKQKVTEAVEARTGMIRVRGQLVDVDAIFGVLERGLSML